MGEILSKEPAVSTTLFLEGRQWSLTLSQHLGQQGGSAYLRPSDQRGKPRAPTCKFRRTVSPKSLPSTGKELWDLPNTPGARGPEAGAEMKRLSGGLTPPKIWSFSQSPHLQGENEKPYQEEVQVETSQNNALGKEGSGKGGSSLGSQFHSSTNPPNHPGTTAQRSGEVRRGLGRTIPAVRRPLPSILTLTLLHGPRAFDPWKEPFLDSQFSLPLSTCPALSPKGFHV